MPNPNPSHNPTDGKNSAAYVQVSGTNGSSVITANKTVGANKPNPGNYSVTLSLSSAGGFHNTVTAAAVLADAANTAFPTAPGVQFAVSSVAAAVAGTTTYTGTITGGGSNAFAGFEFTFSGFAVSANNGTFLCTASTATTLVVTNAAGAVDTTGHAQSLNAAVVFKSYNNPSAAGAWYRPSPYGSYTGDIVSVTSPAGVITALALGQAIVEVQFPTFDSTLGAVNGMVYTQIVVTVIP